ncbi:MAG: NUDIX domain-containing protein [Ancalomicrobiaceae bacterium]|nr:NUDIX domain-containing protein [Ancalomicrobiaceae bacterium]
MDGQRLARALKPMIRRTIGLFGLITRPMTIGVRVLARDEQGRIFLIRHSYLPGWYLPGGAVDPGETCVRAALRELEEEGGLLAEAPRLFGVYHNARISRRDHVLLYTVERPRPGPVAWKPTAEIREIGFFALEALPEGTSAATRRRLAEVIDGLAPADVW